MEALPAHNIHPVRCAGAGGCCWSGVRGKHCWLVLEQNMVNLEV